MTKDEVKDLRTIYSYDSPFKCLDKCVYDYYGEKQQEQQQVDSDYDNFILFVFYPKTCRSRVYSCRNKYCVNDPRVVINPIFTCNSSETPKSKLMDNIQILRHSKL